MDIHYNAFISYRHHPEDIRVASEIHRLLERFRLPKGLRGKAREIERIFRDKEELPITSNLTDDITAALRNSDFLIVICSEHTKESVWVQREIETFLQTHSRTQVLTVLCSGEPYAVIPEILLYEEREDPVTGEKIRVDVEPLSCDWRLPGRQARREELPRLAAVLLGCGYDDLRQRQRHYRMRRMIAAMAVTAALSLGFAGYFLYTSITIQKANVQIQANLDQALRNQSRFLANAAQERLDAGDRLTALALALEALPDYPGERPYVPDAEYVLSYALGIYEKEDIAAVGALGRGENTLLREFWVSREAPLAVIRDVRGVLTTWNTETMEKIGTLPLAGLSIKLLEFVDQDIIVILTESPDNSAYAVTPEGKLLWKRNACWDMAKLPDGTILLLSTDGETRLLQYIDPRTGKELCPRVNAMVPDSENQPSAIVDGGSGVEGTVVLSCWDFEGNDIAVLAPGAQAPELAFKAMPDSSASLVTEEGKLLMMCPREIDMALGSYLGVRVNGEMIFDILCLDLQSRELLWSTELLTYSYTGVNLIEPVPNSDKLLCVSGNVLLTLDGNTGEQISRCETGAGIQAIQVGSEMAMVILQDGFFCNYDIAENVCREYPYMEDDLIQAHVWAGDGLYALQRDSLQVTVYRTVAGEREWNADLGEGVYVLDERVRGDRLAFLDGGWLYLFDHARQEMLLKENIGYARMLDFSEDGSRIWAVQNYTELITVDTEDGSTTVTEFPDEWDGRRSYPSLKAGHILDNDCLYYEVSNYDQAMLVCWNLNTNETRTFSIPLEVFPNGDLMGELNLLACSDGHIWFCSDRAVYAMDLRDGTTHTVMEDLKETPRILYNEGQKVFLSVGTEIYGFDALQPTLTISLEGTRAYTAFVWEESLFVLCDDARVHRFDSTGEKLGALEVDVYNTFVTGLSTIDPYIPSWYVTRDNKLLVNAMGVVTVIDVENWGICAGIADVVGFDPEKNVFLLSGRGTLSGCRLYSTEELLQLAREQLNGFVLSEAERHYYGIG